SALRRSAGPVAACVALFLAAPSAASAGDDPPARARARRAGKKVSPAVTDAMNRLVGGDVADAVRAASLLGGDRSAASLQALIDGLSTGLHPEVAAAALEALAKRRSA